MQRLWCPLFALVLACGANDRDAPRAGPSTPPVASPHAEHREPPARRPQLPEPEPVDVEAGIRLGPIRIGMSEAEVGALGLPETPVDSRSRRFGPYRVFFDNRGVKRVEATISDLRRIRFGSQVFPVGTDIYHLRDAFGDCVWYEGGGERYRCARGTLFVQTQHTLDPAFYLIAVERR
jgi:hypothetical protein